MQQYKTINDVILSRIRTLMIPVDFENEHDILQKIREIQYKTNNILKNLDNLSSCNILTKKYIYEITNFYYNSQLVEVSLVNSDKMNQDILNNKQFFVN